jgi:hypothetical protein
VFEALVWIKSVLEENAVPYQIVGGMAATIHGGSRPVADIDLYIPKISFKNILPNICTFISKPLTHSTEHGWDVEYTQLVYRGQKIEIGFSPGTRLKNANTGEWVELIIDYKESVTGIYAGVEVPVIPISQLISYKSVLGREVDRIDVRELSRILGSLLPYKPGT